MKAKLSIALFILAFALMPTNSIIQGMISIFCLGLSVYLMNKNSKEVSKAVHQFEAKIIKLLKID